jgi:RNA polymerase sigma-70 factor (ECF subfamily)
MFRDHWWGAVATVARLTGDLALAEDSVQESCVVALQQWPAQGVPANPSSWLIGTARHKALDRLRRESQRGVKEADAMRDAADTSGVDASGPSRDDKLSLIFTCCHPALDPQVRVPLTLRVVCGLTNAEIASVFLVPEATMAQRLVRAKRKIRLAGIPFRVPAQADLGARLAAVLRVIYLAYTQGHRSTSGPQLLNLDLCDEAIRLARVLVELLPAEPEAVGLLALLLLTDARTPARLDVQGELVLLADQDRSLWNRSAITEGVSLVELAQRENRPGPYQLQAAIAACHSTASTADATDWRRIALLYEELIRFEPTPVVEANRAVAVAMAEGPAAGLVILETLSGSPQMAAWPLLHIARAALLAKLGRNREAILAYREALAREPAHAEQVHITRRIRELCQPPI